MAAGGPAQCRATGPYLLLIMRTIISRRSCQQLVLLVFVILAETKGLAAWSLLHQVPVPARLSQGQAAGQFLRAVLRADYARAYGRLAPELRRAVSLAQFAAAARPLWKTGVRRSPEIELYKLGVRLGDNGASRLFYSFAFAADSSLKVPSVLLEVTFRDTASRAVLGFGVRPAGMAPTRMKR